MVQNDKTAHFLPDFQDLLIFCNNVRYPAQIFLLLSYGDAFFWKIPWFQLPNRLFQKIYEWGDEGTNPRPPFFRPRYGRWTSRSLSLEDCAHPAVPVGLEWYSGRFPAWLLSRSYWGHSEIPYKGQRPFWNLRRRRTVHRSVAGQSPLAQCGWWS